MLNNFAADADKIEGLSNEIQEANHATITHPLQYDFDIHFNSSGL